MATRTTNKLSAKTVDSAKTPDGLHSDGGGLYLRVAKGGALKSWLYIFQFEGKRKEMGLGALSDVGLADARDAREAARKLVLAGVNPIERRKANAAKTDEPTFAECVSRYIATKKTWRNDKHKSQWETTLGPKKSDESDAVHCDHLCHMPVSKITRADVLKVLEPIWNTKHETAKRLRGRIENVLDYAAGKDWRTGNNPAKWKGNLDAVLGEQQTLTRGHHAAMPYADVPAFVGKLRKLEGLSSYALEFTILTASRTGETLGAKWDEIDLDAKLWTIPKERMKSMKEHVVPLTERTVEILTALADIRINDYVFPGQKKDKPLSNLSMLMLLRRMNLGHLTVHGFRSAFRDWAGDKTDHAFEVIESALAHVIGNSVTRAYRRGKAIEKHKVLLEDWEKYINIKNNLERNKCITQ